MSDDERVLSDLVADRVVKLRRGQGITRERLAAACSELGLPLSTAALGNIETGRRGEDGRRRRDVTVDELLALAVALDVTPATLLVDLDAPEYAVTPGLVVTPVDALVWLWGYGPLPGREPTGSLFPHKSVVIVRILAADWAQLRGIERQAANTTYPSGFADLLRGQRRKLREAASAVAESGVTVPTEIAEYLAKYSDESP
jgi:transcriptional regulator with XRE-family HTH domain